MHNVRFSIGWLMAVVLVAAIDFAALRIANATWAGLLSLLTHGALGLSIFGICFRKGAERAWWIGFFVFGLGYLRLSPWGFVDPEKLPTFLLLEWLRTKSGEPPFRVNPFDQEYYPPLQIARCIWTIPAALLGGLLARFFFEWTPGRLEPNEVSHKASQPLWKLLIPSIAFGLAGLFLIRSVMAIWCNSDAGLWSGGTYLLTCGMLGIATLGAILGRGKRREIWIGASVFGVVYLYMAMASNLYQYDHIRFLAPRATDQFLDAVRPLLPPVSKGMATANERVLKALERPIPMAFPEGTSLGDLLDYIKNATSSPDLPKIPIYVDPIGLQEAERSLESTVQIDLEDVALRTTLDLCLRQIGLYYVVKDGCLRITSADEEFGPVAYDPYRIIGHCLLALMAAAIGAVLAPMVSAVSHKRPRYVEIASAAGTARTSEDSTVALADTK